MIKEAIARLVVGEGLAQDEAEGVMDEIMNGEATPSQIGAFLVALRMKGETADEIAGCARAMRAHATKVVTSRGNIVDTCGTGGDGAGTFNISTVTAFVVAGAGVAVAKHGNRSISSRCGSADVLEAAGVNIDLGPEEMGRCIDEAGIGFLFAPRLHPAMKHAAGPRREMAIRTIFNVLGPLSNPASASRQLLGVYADDLTEVLAGVLDMLGTKHALVVHGSHGLDELSTAGPSKITEVRSGRTRTYSLSPEQLGFSRCGLADLRGGSAAENVAIMKSLLKGERSARRDTVLLNSAAALLVGGKASNLAHGVELAAESIDSGQALQKLEHLASLSQSLKRSGGQPG